MGTGKLRPAPADLAPWPDLKQARLTLAAFLPNDEQQAQMKARTQVQAQVHIVQVRRYVSNFGTAPQSSSTVPRTRRANLKNEALPFKLFTAQVQVHIVQVVILSSSHRLPHIFSKK